MKWTAQDIPGLASHTALVTGANSGLDKTKIGHEISFNKYFYQQKPLRRIKVG